MLPSGSLKTGLPVHVNASFQVAKNRRSLWLDRDDKLDGEHAVWSNWNKALLDVALPTLWLDVIVDMTRDQPDQVLARLPNLATVAEIDPVWLPCATEFYKLGQSRPILPARNPDAQRVWVAPSEVSILEHAPTNAFQAVREDLMQLYGSCLSQFQKSQGMWTCWNGFPSSASVLLWRMHWCGWMWL